MSCTWSATGVCNAHSTFCHPRLPQGHERGVSQELVGNLRMDLPSFLPYKNSCHEYHFDPPGFSVLKDQECKIYVAKSSATNEPISFARSAWAMLTFRTEALIWVNIHL
jgi:hypothetical protein